MPLDELMEISTGSRTFHGNTIDAIFFETIINLFKARFVKISDNDTSEYLNNYKGDTFSYSDGYDFANYLKYQQAEKTLNNISVELAEYFYRIQDVIGFSITDLYE